MTATPQPAVQVLVASDLDRTLIYSSKAARMGRDRPPVVCVEVHDGNEVSFMTAAAAQGLVVLAEAATLVPVTTRVPEQFERITLPGPAPRYAIAANGGVLYVDGTPDRAWSAGVGRVVGSAFPLSAVWEHVGQICRPEWTSKLRNAAGLFCYAVVRRDRLPTGFLDELSGWASERGWRVSLQGSKLYCVPEALTKTAAVAEIVRRTGVELVLAAGDSLLDIDLLLGADLGIQPRHGELHDTGWSAPHVVQTEAVGVCAGEEIVGWFTETTARARGGGCRCASAPQAAGDKDQQQHDTDERREPFG